MKSYLELKVPIRNNAPWFEELRSKICEQGINIRWQNAFSISPGRHILYLTSEHPSEEFSAMVKELRGTLAGTSCDFDKDFRLHVTLGRVFDERVGIGQLKTITSSIKVQPFTLYLPEAQYHEYRGKIINQWTMWPDEKSAVKARDKFKRNAFMNAFSNFGMLDPDF